MNIINLRLFILLVSLNVISVHEAHAISRFYAPFAQWLGGLRASSRMPSSACAGLFYVEGGSASNATPSTITTATTGALRALGLSPRRASRRLVSVDLHQAPSNLRYSFQEPHYSKPGDNVEYVYIEGLSGDDPNRVYWHALSMEGDFARVNGQQVIFSRFFEAFGYQTSQPRITDLNGRGRVVLSMAMNSFRTHNGEKIEEFRWPKISDNTTEDARLYRQLRLMAVLFDMPEMPNFLVSRSGQVVFFNRFRSRLASVSVLPATLPELLRSFSVNSLSVTDLWRIGITDEDIRVFQETLASLSDSIIARIVARGELNDPGLERRLVDGIRHRRNLLLQPFVASDLPGRPSESQVALLASLPGPLQDYWLSTAPHGSPEAAEQKREFRSLVVAHAPVIEQILWNFVNGESTSETDINHPLWHTLWLGHDPEVQYHLPTNLWVALFRKTIELIPDDRDPMTSSHLKIARSLVSHLFLFRPHPPEDLLAAMQTEILEYYQTQPEILGKIMKDLWRFPDVDIHSANYDLFSDRAETLVRLGLNPFVEILLLSVLAAALEHAETHDSWAGRGGGSHNLARVNSGTQHAAAAIQTFLKLNVPQTQLTAGLDLALLVEIFHALTYNRANGTRRLGASITASQVYGLSGDSRPEPHRNIYALIGMYLANPRIIVLPSISPVGSGAP